METTTETTTVETVEETTADTAEAGEAVTDEESTEASEETETDEEGEVIMEGATGVEDSSEWITLDDYEMVYENALYEMWLYEPRLSVVLVNKDTGEEWHTTVMDSEYDGAANSVWEAYMKSGIVISAIVNSTDGYQVDMISVENETSVRKVSGGFEETVYWPSYGFQVTVSVTLDGGDELLVELDDDTIVEEKADSSTSPMVINTLTMFPMMGATHMDEEAGYMLIPDGNGALIYFDDKEGRYSTGFSQMIYGSDAGFRDSNTETLLWDRYDIVTDSKEVIAPIFGLANTDTEQAYLAIVEDGDARCTISAHPNGAIINYNRCYATFTLRQIYTQPLNNTSSGTVQQIESDRTHMDMMVRYILLDGDDADYSGMANAYRDYLLSNKLVQKKLDTSYNTRVDFLGADRESAMLGTRSVAMTTTDEIEEMYAELQAKGIKSLITVYKGWQSGGLYSLPISKYKADSSIGGTRALTKLIENAEKSYYKIYLYNDALQINASTNVTTFNAMKMVNKRTFSIDTHQQIYDTFYYLMPTKSSSTLQKFVKTYTKKGVDNLALAGISNTLFSYSSKGSYYSRQDSMKTYQKAISSISDDVDLVLEEPAAYLWQYTDAFLDMPLGDSDYMFVEDEVPFLSMVLKGIIPMYSDYVNFEANKSEFFLKLVESGVYPSFYLTYENSSALIYTNSSDLYSTEFATYADTVVQYDEELRELADLTDGAYMTKHEILESGVRKVTYDNGVLIYVNYNDEDITVDGVTVGAMSYKVGEAE